MSQNVDIISKFDEDFALKPIFHRLKILNINFTAKLALCELEIDIQTINFTSNVIKFSNIISVINNVSIKCDDQWLDCKFENIYNELKTVNLDSVQHSIMNQKALYTRIYNMEDNIGHGNLHIIVPTEIAKIIQNNIITLKFSFHFQYLGSKIDDEGNDINFDEYYLSLFHTPYNLNTPTGGYRICAWMPFINKTSWSTPWQIEVFTPLGMVPICQGNLISTRHCSNNLSIAWNFEIDFSISPANIFIMVGNLESKDVSPSIVGYSLPSQVDLIESTLSFFPTLLNHLIDNMCITLPFDKIIIIFTSYEVRFSVFSNIILLPSCIMCPKNIILQMQKNFKLFTSVLCEIIFGYLIIPSTLADIWLIIGLNKLLYYNFRKSFNGICEYTRIIAKEHKKASQFPNSWWDIVFYLTPHVFQQSILQDISESITAAEALNKWCISSHPEILSHPKLWKTFAARSGLAMVSIEKQVTSNHLNQIILNMFSNFNEYIRSYRLSTETFFNLILNVTGKDIFIQICRNFLSVTRPLLLTLDYSYNRRKSTLEITFTNEDYALETKVPISISLTVQEADGAFVHVLQFNRDVRVSSFELNTNSGRIRRNASKRRVFTENGKEIDVDVIRSTSGNGDQMAFSDNPVLFVRINLDQSTFFGDVRVNQPDSSWYYQAAVESNPFNHLTGVEILKSFPCDETLHLLTKLIKSKVVWYRVRAAAFESLVFIHNQLTTEEIVRLDRDLNPIDLYRIAFGYPPHPELPKINDFTNIPLHLFQLSAIKSISNLKMALLKDVPKPRIFLCYELLRTLYEYNDNSSNYFDDCCYRSTVLYALGDSLNQLKNDFFQQACSFVLAESLSCFKLEELSSYIHGCLSIAALSNILKLQKLNYIPPSSNIFTYCCLPGINTRIRLKAIFILAEYIQINQSLDDYKFLINIFIFDPSPKIRQSVLTSLTKFPPFEFIDPKSRESPIRNSSIQSYLRNIINTLYYQEINTSFLHQLSLHYDTLFGQTISNFNEEEPSLVNSYMKANTKLDSEGFVKIVLSNTNNCL